MMDPIVISGIGLTVTLLTEITKRITGKRKGKAVSSYAVSWAVVGVVIWYMSQSDLPSRLDLFPAFSAIVVVAATAMGIYETVKGAYVVPTTPFGVRREPS